MDFDISREPLYIRVKNAILEAIQSGEFNNNKQLPSEKILATKFKVSRATIRSALQSLEDDNIIRKQQGIGTFFTHENFLTQMRIDKVKGFYQLLKDTGHKPSVREEGFFREPFDKRICKKLNVPAGTEALIIKRTLLGDGKAAIHLCEYIPANALTHKPNIKKLPKSIVEISEQLISQRVEYSIAEIIPTKVDSAMVKILNLPKDKPILRLEETHFNPKNEPIIFSEVFVNDRIIRFNVIRTRDR